MRNPFAVMVSVLILAVSFSSCFRHHQHYTSVTISDSRDEYELYASYDRQRTRKIQRLLDRELNVDFNRYFNNAHVDELITLDDHTTFYMRSLPGELKIRVDKSANPGDSWVKIQNVCEDIKEALQRN